MMQWCQSGSAWIGGSSDHQPEWVVGWLHGLGATGAEFKPVIEALSYQWQASVEWHVLQAPDRPVTLHGGRVMPAWYDLYGLSENATQDVVGIQAAAQNLQHWCQAQLDRGLQSRQIILIGFSQGGALALYTALTMPMTLGAVVGLSTYLPLTDQLSQAVVTQSAPICLMHGDQDPLIPSSAATATHTHLKQLTQGAVDLFWYPMGHTVCPEQIDQLIQWLSALSPREA